MFIPKVPCKHINPTADICKISANSGDSIFSLAPVYDTIIYPIPNVSRGQLVTEALFEKFNNVKMKDFLTFVEQKRVIPYFYNDYTDYDETFVKNFLEPALPRISNLHFELISQMDTCALVDNDCQKCQTQSKTAYADIKNIRGGETEEDVLTSCTQCLSSLYAFGINRETILKSKETLSTICALRDITVSRNMNAVVKSNCPIAKNALGVFAGITDKNKAIDLIVKGLKISYSYDMDLESYLQLLDGNTTKAVRQIIAKIMEDPYAMKYSERLNAKLCDLNKEIHEVGKTRSAKFYKAVSDIAVYGGSKYAEGQSGGLVKPKTKDIGRTSEWVASKLFDVHTRITGKGWAIAQIYKARSKMEKCTRS